MPRKVLLLPSGLLKGSWPCSCVAGVGSKGAQSRREQEGNGRYQQTCRIRFRTSDLPPPSPRCWQEAASPPQVGLGWATIRFDGTKVRDGKSSDAAVVRTLNEGHRVLVVEVRSKSVRISIPSCGWVKLQRHSEPVLQQEACDVRKPGEASATTQVTNSVLQRLGVMPKPAEERLMSALSLSLSLMRVLTDCSMHGALGQLRFQSENLLQSAFSQPC